MVQELLEELDLSLRNSVGAVVKRPFKVVYLQGLMDQIKDWVGKEEAEWKKTLDDYLTSLPEQELPISGIAPCNDCWTDQQVMQLYEQKKDEMDLVQLVVALFLGDFEDV